MVSTLSGYDAVKTMKNKHTPQHIADIMKVFGLCGHGTLSYNDHIAQYGHHTLGRTVTT